MANMTPEQVAQVQQSLAKIAPIADHGGGALLQSIEKASNRPGTPLLTSPWIRPGGGNVPSRDMTFEKERPWLFAGFRPQTYRIFVDGKLV
jgi:hypothetical protein